MVVERPARAQVGPDLLILHDFVEFLIEVDLLLLQDLLLPKKVLLLNGHMILFLHTFGRPVLHRGEHRVTWIPVPA